MFLEARILFCVHAVVKEIGKNRYVPCSGSGVNREEVIVTKPSNRLDDFVCKIFIAVPAAKNCLSGEHQETK